MMSKKIDIKQELEAVDLRNYDFYSKLTSEEKKSVNLYNLMRFTSNVQGDLDLLDWFLERTNEMVNKNYFSLSKNHKELLWKLYAGIGTGVKCFHPYIKLENTNKVSKFEKLLSDLKPTAKLEDIQLEAMLMSDQEKSELLDKLGLDKEQRKEYE